jgi:SPX domain protein involved in polyphosphate accumulation
VLFTLSSPSTRPESKLITPSVIFLSLSAAFQIPHDATVRISLDTNLCMLTETGRLGMNDRWFRDPSKPVPKKEITRFPHAVLEVKLQLKVGGRGSVGRQRWWAAGGLAPGTIVQSGKRYGPFGADNR